MNRGAMLAGAASAALLVALTLWLLRPVDPPTAIATAPEASKPSIHPRHSADEAMTESMDDVASEEAPTRADKPEIAPGQDAPEPRAEPTLASDELVKERYEELREMVRASVSHHEKALGLARLRGDDAEIERRTILLERAKKRLARLEESEGAVLEDLAAERGAQDTG